MTINTVRLAAISTAVNVALSVDRTIAKAEVAKNDMAKEVMPGLIDGTYKLDDFRADLLNAYKAKLPAKARNAVTSLNHCESSTLKGWYHDVKRVYEAGLGDKVVQGESVTSVRRATAGANPPKAKASTPAVPAPPAFAASLAAVNAAISMALADNTLAVAMAGNADLATLIANIGKLTAKVEALATVPLANAA